MRERNGTQWDSLSDQIIRNSIPWISRYCKQGRQWLLIQSKKLKKPWFWIWFSRSIEEDWKRYTSKGEGLEWWEMMTFEEGTKTVKIRICQLILYLYNFYDWIYLKNEGNTIVWRLYWRTIESTVRNCLKRVEYLQPIKTHKKQHTWKINWIERWERNIRYRMIELVIVMRSKGNVYNRQQSTHYTREIQELEWCQLVLCELLIHDSLDMRWRTI